jgi:hypothetical protein
MDPVLLEYLQMGARYNLSGTMGLYSSDQLLINDQSTEDSHTVVSLLCPPKIPGHVRSLTLHIIKELVNFAQCSERRFPPLSFS